LSHGPSLVQGDPRAFLKRLEKEQMYQCWKKQAPKQFEWFSCYPTQILNRSKAVWKWAVESGCGKAWLYFIFAICQWLPTKYRLNYYREDSRKRCDFCVSAPKEDMDHLLQCPALRPEQQQLELNVTHKLQLLGVPYVERKITPRGDRLCNLWSRIASEKFAGIFTVPRINFLAKGFWRANQRKAIISTSDFLQALTDLKERPRNSPSACELIVPCEPLLRILIETFCLHRHAFTDPLKVFMQFESWSSESDADIKFGADVLLPDTTLVGANAFVTCGSEKMSALMNRLIDSLSESLPTRILCMTPSRNDLPRHVLEITRISAGSPFCYRTDSQISVALPFDISLLLFLNKESMLIDPIDWDLFMSRIAIWAKSGQSIIIPQQTDALFKERSCSPPSCTSKHG